MSASAMLLCEYSSQLAIEGTRTSWCRVKASKLERHSDLCGAAVKPCLGRRKGQNSRCCVMDDLCAEDIGVPGIKSEHSRKLHHLSLSFPFISIVSIILSFSKSSAQHHTSSRGTRQLVATLEASELSTVAYQPRHLIYPSPRQSSKCRWETPASLAQKFAGTAAPQTVSSAVRSSLQPCLAEKWEKRAWPFWHLGMNGARMMPNWHWSCISYLIVLFLSPLSLPRSLV